MTPFKLFLLNILSCGPYGIGAVLGRAVIDNKDINLLVCSMKMCF